MNRRITAIVLGFIVSLFNITKAHAGPVLFTSEATFRAAVGDVQEIDFETLPDGTPSFIFAEITPEFNYTEQGVEFFSSDSDLFIAGSPGAFSLFAGPLELPSTGPLTWIIADPVEPVFAAAFHFPGSTSVRVFDELGGRILTAEVNTPRGVPLGFAGVYSVERPIGWIEIDRGSDNELIVDFSFLVIPEPATSLLLLVGTGFVVRVRRNC